jgi:hypothetical protein
MAAGIEKERARRFLFISDEKVKNDVTSCTANHTNGFRRR